MRLVAVVESEKSKVIAGRRVFPRQLPSGCQAVRPETSIRAPVSSLAEV